MTKSIETPGKSPGALRSHAILEIQTRQAQRLVYGRKAAGEQSGIVGLMRFATLLRLIWSGAANDDPYADWWLLQVEQALMQSREDLSALQKQVGGLLKKAPGVSVTVAESLEPIRVDLNFANPYAFMASYLLADYDAVVRAILTARHVALIDRDTAEKMLAEGGRYTRRAYESAHGYRFLAVTREDVRQGTSKATRAHETLETTLPVEVIDGTLRASHAPDIRQRQSAKTLDESPEPDESIEDDADGLSAATAKTAAG